MKNSKFTGSTLIVIGTTVGAGMLAQPMMSAGAGFPWSLLLMFTAWLVSLLAGLLIIEVNLAMPTHSCSYSSMAKHTLGSIGKFVTWLSYLFLLYAMITAYVIGASNFISSTFSPIFHVEIPKWLSAALFTVVLGGAVYWSTKATDYCNRFLLSAKMILLILALAIIAPHIGIDKLTAYQGASQLKFLWVAIPTFVLAFGFHFVIPSLRIYMGDNAKQLKAAVFIGTTVSLVIYLWWLASSFGVIPITGTPSFSSLTNTPGAAEDPAEFVNLLSGIINNGWVTSSMATFTNIALTTSFLGVALGLFDFLAEGFHRKDTRFGRFQTACMTFTPPLLIAIFYPKGFYLAINYATIPLAILTLILPALMAISLRLSKNLKSTYQVKFGKLAIVIVTLAGILSIVLAIMYILHRLPMFK